MIRYYLKKQQLRRQRPNLRVIRNLRGVNENNAKTYYVDLDTAEVFRVDERSHTMKVNSMGQEYDIIISKIEGDNSRTKQGDPCIHINGYMYTLARIVASTGLENPHFCSDILHRDGNRYNNCISNLMWCTRSENMKHHYAEKNKYKEKKPKNEAIVKDRLSDAEKMIEDLSKDFDWDSIVWSEG